MLIDGMQGLVATYTERESAGQIQLQVLDQLLQLTTQIVFFDEGHRHLPETHDPAQGDPGVSGH